MFGGFAGFTLPEAMIGVALTGLLGALTMECFYASSQVCNATSVYSRVSSDTRLGMDRMTRELRNSSVNQILSPQLNASANVLQFRVPASISATGRITWSNVIEYRVGGSQGNQLVRRDFGTGQMNLISSRVNNVQFLLSGNPPVLRITLTCGARTADGKLTIPSVLTGMVQFRNPSDASGGNDSYYGDDAGDYYGGDDSYYGDYYGDYYGGGDGYYGDYYGGEPYYGDYYGDTGGGTDPYYGDYYGGGGDAPPEDWYYMEYYGVPEPPPEPVVDYYGYYGDPEPIPEPEPIVDYYYGEPEILPEPEPIADYYYGIPEPIPEPEPVVDYYGTDEDSWNWPEEQPVTNYYGYPS